MAMLSEVSRNIRMTAPNVMATQNVSLRLPALGSSVITMTAMTAPTIR